MICSESNDWLTKPSVWSPARTTPVPKSTIRPTTTIGRRLPSLLGINGTPVSTPDKLAPIVEPKMDFWRLARGLPETAPLNLTPGKRPVRKRTKSRAATAVGTSRLLASAAASAAARAALAPRPQSPVVGLPPPQGRRRKPKPKPKPAETHVPPKDFLRNTFCLFCGKGPFPLDCGCRWLDPAIVLDNKILAQTWRIQNMSTDFTDQEKEVLEDHLTELLRQRKAQEFSRAPQHTPPCCKHDHVMGFVMCHGRVRNVVWGVTTHDICDWHGGPSPCVCAPCVMQNWVSQIRTYHPCAGLVFATTRTSVAPVSHISVPYTCPIYVFYISVPYKCPIYVSHIRVPYKLLGALDESNDWLKQISHVTSFFLNHYIKIQDEHTEPLAGVYSHGKPIESSGVVLKNVPGRTRLGDIPPHSPYPRASVPMDRVLEIMIQRSIQGGSCYRPISGIRRRNS